MTVFPVNWGVVNSPGSLCKLTLVFHLERTGEKQFLKNPSEIYQFANLQGNLKFSRSRGVDKQRAAFFAGVVLFSSCLSWFLWIRGFRW